MKQATREFNQKLVLASLQAIQDWETWTNAVTSGAVLAMNLSLIRLSKGLIKAWRTYLIETFKNERLTPEERVVTDVLLTGDAFRTKHGYANIGELLNELRDKKSKGAFNNPVL